MKKKLFKITCYTPNCGTDATYWVLANKEEDINGVDLDCWARDNAEAYEYLETGWGEGFNSEEEEEEYYAGCGCDISGPYSLEEAEDEGYPGQADAEY